MGLYKTNGEQRVAPDMDQNFSLDEKEREIMAIVDPLILNENILKKVKEVDLEAGIKGLEFLINHYMSLSGAKAVYNEKRSKLLEERDRRLQGK